MKAWCGLRGSLDWLLPCFEMFQKCDCMLKPYDQHLHVFAVHFPYAVLLFPEKGSCGSSARRVAVYLQILKVDLS